MGLDINIYGFMVEWSRPLDFCTETSNNFSGVFKTLRCAIPVVCVTNEREENVVKQHN